MKGLETEAAAEPGRHRKTLLLEEAAMELNARGVGQASLADIAARMGVTRTALYNYVDDQRDLVFQCYRHSCEMLAMRLTRARQESGNAWECLEYFIDAMIAPDKAPVAVISDLFFLDDERRDTIAGLLSGLITEISYIIEAGVREGTIRPCRSFVAARAVLAYISWPPLLRHTVPDVAIATAPKLAETIKTLLRSGLAACRTEFVPIQRRVGATGNEPFTNLFERRAVAQAKKEMLLAKGSMLLNEKGVYFTSLDEIAASVGVSKAVIYHNIGDKPTFVLECFRRALRMTRDVVGRMDASQGSRLDALTNAIHDVALMHLRENAPLLFPVIGFASVSEDLAAEVRQGMQYLQQAYGEAVRAGIAEGSLRDQDSATLLAVMPAFVQWLYKWRSMPPGSEDSDEETAAELARLVSVGLAPLD